MFSINVSSETGKQELDKVVSKYGKTIVSFLYPDGKKEIRRLARSHGNDIIVMERGKHRWGAPLFHNSWYENVTVIIPDKSEKSEAQKWEEGWKKVVTRLQASGLWEDYRKDIETGLNIGYEKIQKANDLYWTPWASTAIEKEEQIQKFKELDPRLVSVAKDDGNEYPDTSIIWTLHHAPKIKKMYFGKYETNRILTNLSIALEKGVELEEHAVAGYDVSVHYKPGVEGHGDCMWYSEEYRNCGNGHYYLGLDATHAVFGEDD